MSVGRRIANLLGYELRPLKKIDRLDTIPVSLRHYFSTHPVDLVVDCGAYVGKFALNCRKAGYQGDILSLEPAQRQHAELQRIAAGDPRWSVRQIGAGMSRQSMTLNTFADGDFNSIHVAKTELFDLKPTAGEQIELHRLDDVLQDYPRARNVFLKSDTQGNDLAVLQGLGSRLADVQAILVEMSVQRIYETAPSHWQVFDFMKSAGFEPYTFSPVTRDAKGALIEYDALFWRADRRGAA